MGRFLKLLVGFVLVAGIVFGVYSYIHRRAQSGRLGLLNAEYSYLASLRDLLQKQANPESQSSVSVFVSANVLNSVLSGADGLSFALPKSKDTSVKLNSVRTEFRDGFPGVLANIEVSRQNPTLTTQAELYSVLEPRIDKTDATNLLLYVHPLYIRIGTQALSVSTENERKAESLLGDIASQYSELLPHLTIPLAKDFSVAFPSNQLPLTVPTQAGKLNGQIDVPGLSLQSTVSVSGVLFLSDGVHVFLAANTQPAKSTQGTVFPYRIEDHPAVYTSGSNLDSAIKQKDGQIQSLRASMQSLTSPLKVADSDVRIWVSKSLLSTVSDVFNSVPAQGRKIHFHTLSEDGQLYSVGGGGAGCGGYAELVGHNSASADLVVSNLTGTWTNQGLTEAADFQFSFDAQVTGHVNGPAGPHTFWVSNCTKIFGVTQCLPPVPSVTVSCETPIGGGVGLGSYGVHGDRTERLAATLTLHSDASSWLIYDLAVTSPDQIPITVSVGLGQLGSVGIPISFNVPHQALLSGKAPSVFSQSGVLEDPISHSSKKYTFAIAPTAGTVQPDGYAATGKLTVQWQ
jgi:hypothetical protein